MIPKKNPQRLKTKFGAYLTYLREHKAHIGMAEAARELGFRTRQQLANYESGRTTPSYVTLLKLAQLYNVSLDEILRRAYWPQLILLPIDFIINVDELSSEDVLAEIKNGLDAAERKKLTQFIEKLLRERSALKRR